MITHNQLDFIKKRRKGMLLKSGMKDGIIKHHSIDVRIQKCWKSLLTNYVYHFHHFHKLYEVLKDKN